MPKKLNLWDHNQKLFEHDLRKIFSEKILNQLKAKFLRIVYGAVKSPENGLPRLKN